MATPQNDDRIASTDVPDESKYCISSEDIKQAAARIQGAAHYTPVLTTASINRQSGGRNVFFKVEALQRTGSFKFRGAFNAIQSVLSQFESNQAPASLSVVTHSSGNHAQAVALAAKLSSTSQTTVTATIVMPENTPAVKKSAVSDFGGNIIIVANTNEAREEKADEIAAETGATFVHPSEDPHVIAGQGTVCLELVEQVAQQQNEPIDLVIIPVGGGGLAAGNAISLRGILGDKVRIVLAEPAKMDDAKRSFEAGQLLQHDPGNNLDSVADGLKTTLGPNTWPIVRDLVDDIFTVTEEDILAATKFIWERLKVCIEPSAGVGVAVLLSDAFQAKYPADKYKNIGCVLCGGNVDVVKIAARMQEADL